MKFDVLAYSLIIALLIYILFFLDDTNTPKPINNSVSPVIINEKPANNKSIAKKISDKKNEAQKKINWLKGYDKNNDHTPVVGLIQAFREFRKLKRCRVVIEAVANNTDPYQAYLTNANKYKRGINSIEFTSKQHQFFDKWTDSCLDLLEYDGELYTAAHERYRKRFYQTKPKTKREKDFAKSWPLKEATEYIVLKYRTLITGYDKNNEQQATKLKRYLRRAKGRLGYININNDIDFSSRTSNEIVMYEKQINEIEDILNGTIEIDESYTSHLTNQFQSQIQIVEDFLKQNTSSDAFHTLAPHLFSVKNKEMGVYDRQYYNQLIHPVYQIYACTMDADCSEYSKFMVAACFQNRNNDDTACGKGIEDYYLNYYFSPNQLMDINLLLNYFFDNYAQN